MSYLAKYQPSKEDFEKIVKVVERAEQMNIARGERFTRIMDIEFAHHQFNLRLDEMLEADDLDFAHDFIGIQNHINRSTFTVEDFFVPRFAGRSAA